jgi:hypothetical protein
VARLNPRLAAGVGVLSVFLLLGGPGATVAFSDPGSSHSDRGSGSTKDQDRGDSEGGEADDGSGNGNGNGDGHGDGNSGNHHADASVKQDDDVTPKVRVGSGRDEQQWIGPGGSVTENDAGATGETGPADAPGSDHQGAPDAGFQSPRVTFGNGRTPGDHGDGPQPHWQAPARQAELEPAPPPPPPPPPAPAPPSSWVDRIATPPVPTKQLGVAPAADWSDPLWGIAGLLLIPAAGAALGYRQARAAQAVDRLHRP